MTMKLFIKENRAALDKAILDRLHPHVVRLNDKERAEWVLNDESLYQWARESGVRI